MAVQRKSGKTQDLFSSPSTGYQIAPLACLLQGAARGRIKAHRAAFTDELSPHSVELVLRKGTAGGSGTVARRALTAVLQQASNTMSLPRIYISTSISGLVQLLPFP